MAELHSVLVPKVKPPPKREAVAGLDIYGLLGKPPASTGSTGSINQSSAPAGTGGSGGSRKRKRRRTRRRRKRRTRRRKRRTRRRRKRNRRRKTRRGGGGGRIWKVHTNVEAYHNGEWKIGKVDTDDITHNNIKFTDGTVQRIANNKIRDIPVPPRPRLTRNRRRVHPRHVTHNNNNDDDNNN